MNATRVMTHLLANFQTINHRMLSRGVSRLIHHSDGSDFTGNSENKLQQLTNQQQRLIKHQQSLAHSIAVFNGRCIALSEQVKSHLLQRLRNDCPFGWEVSAEKHLIVGKSKITKVCLNAESKRVSENLWNDLTSKIYPTVINNRGLSDFLYKHSVIPSEYFPDQYKITALPKDIVELEICGSKPEARDSMIAELSSLIGNPVYQLSQILKDRDKEPQHCREVVGELLKKVNNDGLPCAIVAIDVDQLKEGILASDLIPEIKQQLSRCGQKAIVFLMNSDQANISTFPHGNHRYYIEPPEEIRQLTGNQEVLSELLVKYNELSREIPDQAQVPLQKRLLSELPHGWRIKTIVDNRKLQITDLLFSVDARVSDYLRRTIRNYVSENQISTVVDFDWKATEKRLADKIPWELSEEDENHHCTEVVKDYFAKLRHYCRVQDLGEVTQDAVDECTLRDYLQI